MRTFAIASVAAMALALDHEGLIGGPAPSRPQMRAPTMMNPQARAPQQPMMQRPQMNMDDAAAARQAADMMREQGAAMKAAAQAEHEAEHMRAAMDADIEHVVEDQEIDLAALVANNTSPPTENQLLNVLASKLEGFVNPDGILDDSALYHELPRKIVGRRSRNGAEFGCYWPADMQFWGYEYESQSAYCKSEQIWERVLEDDRIQDWFDGVAQLPMFFQDTNDTFDWIGDDMPEGRLKIVHTRGTVTRINYESVGDHPYTGIFKGAQHGIMRISEVNRTVPDVVRTSPGFGVKFLRDGYTSANGLAMFSFAGQPSFNFLANSWTTHLAEPQNTCGRMTVSSKFAEGTRHLGNTSVMEWAEVDEHGYKEACPVWPFMLRFEPTITTAWPDTFQAEFHEQMQLIQDDFHLFDVYALDEPIGMGGEEKLIGKLNT